MPVTHNFVSAIPDDPAAAAAGQVLPSHWNASHSVAVAVSEITATGTPSSGTFLRGDGSWQAVTTSPAGSSGDLQINSSGAFAALTPGTGVSTALAANVTGSGGIVLATSPTLTTPALGTPSALTLTNATGLPVGGISATGTPSSGTFLRGDGSWSAAASSLTPGTTATSGGAAGQIMFDTGSVLQESSGLVWDNTNLALNVTGATKTGVTLSGVAITGTGGQFSCSAASATLKVGMYLTISGTKGGGGNISGYVNPTTYLISATNGSTTFTLSTLAGNSVTTTAGTPTGLTYSYDPYPLLNLSQTWNNANAAFNGVYFNVTNTASNSFSALINLQVDGVSVIRGQTNGALYLTNPSSGLNQYYGVISDTIGAASQHFVIQSQKNIILYTGAGRSVTIADATAPSLGFQTSTTTIAPDLLLTRRAAANLQLGAADAAAPVAQTLSAQSVVAGTSNTAGANFTIAGSQGTGTGAGGSIIFQVAPAGTSGSSQNALATALTIDSTKTATFSGSVNVGNIQLSSGSVLYFNGFNSSTRINNSGYVADSAAIFCWGQPGSYASSSDLVLSRRAAGNLQLGYGDAGTNTTATMTIATPAVVTVNNHGYSTGSPVYFTTTGALPTGVTANTIYYVIYVGVSTFNLATSEANAYAGTALATSGSQSGTHTIYRGALAQAITFQGQITNSNMPGPSTRYQASAGTGSGIGGSHIFQVAPAGTSGSTQNSYATAMVIDSTKTVLVGAGFTVATLPAAGTAGRRAYVTDATAPTFLGTLTGGGSVVCPVFDNGTNWVSG